MKKKNKGIAALLLLVAIVAVSVPAIVSANRANHAEQVVPIVAQANQVQESAVYENTQYGFRFTLPDSWKGYTIVTDKWTGQDATDGKAVESGASIGIRHPEWTADKPRQDIPIYVFTIDQWNALQQEKFFIGAAPVGPSELTRNDKYVFALPARYNFAYLDGYQEVEDILKDNPIQPL
ncbi:hypothetical protein [Paenibacillus lignilyticus]|uniref:Uncharacterized protein n=1 Tax=Paenibacillus lignilyticus TaxID=1172615 RepID=A0ABS5CDM7_9BACL|nr:hypothetical protein [Paenibacillus lignilyticus]MBP3964089.1 hypothetical protein [Paenibacillus lignilyticus]